MNKPNKSIVLIILLMFPFLSCNNNTDKEDINNHSKENKVMESTKEQKEGIARSIEYYMEGGRQADGTITAKAFTDNATMSWTENGKLVSVPIQTLYDIVTNGKAEAASYEIVSLDVQEDIAIVHIKSQFGEAKYYDMFSLVKDGSDWKIVSKIYRNR